MLRISEDQLDLMPKPSPWGAGRWSYNGNPFTGIAYEYWPNSQILHIESEYVDGYEQGLQREYHSNGQLRLEYFKKDDFVYNYMKKWDLLGVLVYHVEYNKYGHITNAILY